MTFRKASLRNKLLTFGILISVVFMSSGLLLSVLSFNKMGDAASEECMKLAFSDLEHIVENVHANSIAQNGLAQMLLSNALKTARSLLSDTGKVSFLREKTVTWDAINQFTKKTERITLPKMMVGDEWLGQNKDIRVTSPIVDKTRDLSVETCTIFQRMNKQGDMLRVSTNVQKLDGSRAIGTYIPAINPDGTPNAVVSAVMKGQTFKGRAWVVNAWYLTSYEPIIDNSGEVVGILYVGIKQRTVEKSLADQITKIQIGKTGSVTVLNSKGEMIVSERNAPNGENVWEAKDGQGHYYIQEIIEKAHSLNNDEIGSHRYMWGENQEKPQTKIVRIKYFEPWDWVIAAGAYEKEFLYARDKIITLGEKSIFRYIITSIIVVTLAVLFSIYFARSISKPINRVSADLSEGAEQVASASEQVSCASQSLAEGSSEQAATLEETSSSLEEMSSMTKQNAGNASKADNLMKEANQVVSKANTSMKDLTTSMKEISKASEETSQIIKTIDEIAFQTNLLALNAAVEAARAGEAGAGFAVVADEVRNLAMRAADAAKDTSDLIEGTVMKVKDGSELVTSTTEAFTEVATSASKVGELVGEISAASNEQAQGIEQVNRAVAEMDKVVQGVASSAEESASASEEMNAQAERMNKIVHELMALVGGSRTNKQASQHTKRATSLDKAAAGAGNMLRKALAAPRKKATNHTKAQEVKPEDEIFMAKGDFKDF